MTDLVQTIENDAAAAVNLAKEVIAKVKADLVILKDEGEKLISWVDANVPGAQTAIAQLVSEADADAQALVKLGGQGLSDAIAAAEPELETLLANVIQATGLAKTAAGGTLQALDAVGVNTLKTIGQALVSKLLVVVLSKLAPAVAAIA